MHPNSDIGKCPENMDEEVLKDIDEALACFLELRENSLNFMPRFKKLVEDAVHCMNEGQIVAFAGNGGSFADAQHMAAEFTGKLSKEREPLPAIVLGSNSSSISAIGNDFGYSLVFAREFSALSKSVGLVVGFSTSGSSENIIELGKAAQREGTPFYCFTGRDEGLVSNVGLTIPAPSTRTERVQEIHTTLGHIFCSLVEKELGLL